MKRRRELLAWILLTIDAGGANGGYWLVEHHCPNANYPAAAAMLPSGKILVWSSNEPLGFETDIGDTPSRTLMSVYDPATGAVSPLMDAGVKVDMFCPGIAYLPNGEILVAGGSSSDHTSIHAYRFDAQEVIDG